MGYTDKDGAIVFVACAWVHANCGVALMDLVDAAQGVRECNPRDAMCYFRANLIGRITKAKFDELWDRTKHPKPGDWGPSNCEPAPRRGKQERMGDVTEQIVNRIIPKEEADERHAELRRQIQHARLA